MPSGHTARQRVPTHLVIAGASGTPIRTATIRTMSSQVVTPQLRDWIVAQARAGCRPEDVLQSMRTSGWDEDTAIDALESTLQDYLAEQQKPVQQLPPGVPVP